MYIKNLRITILQQVHISDFQKAHTKWIEKTRSSVSWKSTLPFSTFIGSQDNKTKWNSKMVVDVTGTKAIAGKSLRQKRLRWVSSVAISSSLTFVYAYWARSELNLINLRVGQGSKQAKETLTQNLFPFDVDQTSYWEQEEDYPSSQNIHTGTIRDEKLRNCSYWAVTALRQATTSANESTVSTIVQTVNRIANQYNNSSWCVLVVATRSAKDAFLKTLSRHQRNVTQHPKNVVWLTQHDHRHWSHAKSSAVRSLCRLLSSLDDSTTAARNLGYLYAILHGAKYILEIPSDYLLAVPDGKRDDWWNTILARVFTTSTDSSTTSLSMVSLGLHLFNPYPLMTNGTVTETVPFGFPPEYRNNSNTHGSIALTKTSIPPAYENETVKSNRNWKWNEQLQSEMNGLMKTSPYSNWTRQILAEASVTRIVVQRDNDADLLMTANEIKNYGLVVPSHAFAPYSLQKDDSNDQAGFILSAPSTLWALLLPLGLPCDELSDVWRSFIAQTLFRDAGLRVIFRPIHTPRAAKGKMDGVTTATINSTCELNYRRHSQTTTRLIDFLQEWSSSCNPSKDALWTVDGRMEQLWSDLARESFLSPKDVEMARLWRQVLLESELSRQLDGLPALFPPLRPRISNVILMGQFNYENIPASDIIFWVQKQQEYFSRVTVRGPFSNQTLDELSSHGISAYIGPSSRGFWDPLYNLVASLEEAYEEQSKNQVSLLFPATNQRRTDGVLYAHDDAILNLTQFFSISANQLQQEYRHGVFPVSGIIATQTVPEMYVYTTYKDFRSSPMSALDTFRAERSYKIYPNASLFTRLNSNQTFTQWEEFKKHISSLAPRWPWHHLCLDRQMMLAKNPNSSRYQEPDGSILFSAFSQADFLFVPLHVTPEFAHAARLHLQDPKIFLECAVPTVVDMVRRTTNVSVMTIELCTTFQSGRSKPSMIKRCYNLRDQNGYEFGMYHPFKLSQGLEYWNDIFHLVTG